MTRALVTGLNGFAGRHLGEALRLEAIETIGLVRDPAEGGGEGSGFVRGDITDRASLERAFAEIRPDWVFHLAGKAYVPESWDKAEEHLRVNLGGTLNVLEAARRAAPGARVVLAGSGEVYGFGIESGRAIDETTLCEPATPYGVSKLAADLLGMDYHRRYGSDVVRLRLFNHTGPGQRPDFALPSFARQIARIEAGLAQPVLEVGDLEVERVFTDVRDVARAYVAAARSGRAGLCYNVGRSPSYRVRHLVDKLLALSRVRIEVRVDPARVRPGQIASIACDASRFARDTGWRPEVPIEQTLQDLMDYWRSNSAHREEPATP
ncbi:MAG: GDP-mannose 4,6-dehydratase [Candidatus Wallbacteria bacterium]|nr:GDP-mannose 4,6-dehydratase [Candidatus Wallbacteria bacterium]